MNLLSAIPKEELQDKVVLVRAGLNVPLAEDGSIVDAFRIGTALPTIEYLAKHAKKVIIIAHMGRERSDTLAPVSKLLQEHLPELVFCQWADHTMLNNSKIVLMENVRQDPREVSLGESDRAALAAELVAITKANIFIQDAFSVCHRDHASITDIPKLLPSYAGLLVEKEVEQLGKALRPPSPSLFILGGAKFATKEPLIRKFLSLYGRVFIGGAIANEFFKARGYEIGHSLVHDGSIPHDILYDDKIILPTSVRVADTDGHTIYVSPQEVLPNMRIVDAVPPSDLLSNPATKFVLWNGPLGYYEGGFSQGTETLLEMFKSGHTRSGLEVLTGGGDTLATIGQEYRDMFTHISAGGGAMLTYMQEGTLIGLKELE